MPKLLSDKTWSSMPAFQEACSDVSLFTTAEVRAALGGQKVQVNFDDLNRALEYLADKVLQGSEGLDPLPLRYTFASLGSERIQAMRERTAHKRIPSLSLPVAEAGCLLERDTLSEFLKSTMGLDIQGVPFDQQGQRGPHKRLFHAQTDGLIMALLNLAYAAKVPLYISGTGQNGFMVDALSRLRAHYKTTVMPIVMSQGDKLKRANLLSNARGEDYKNPKKAKEAIRSQHRAFREGLPSHLAFANNVVLLMPNPDYSQKEQTTPSYLARPARFIEVAVRENGVWTVKESEMFKKLMRRVGFDPRDIQHEPGVELPRLQR